MEKEKIGFIGQGWIGKNYADDFERRGFEVVRYSLEPEYLSNKSAIGLCDIVFIAVPTLTTPAGFDYSIVKEVVGLVGKGKTAVIKSTILPGTTEKLQETYPEIYVFHSPEFLAEKTASYDAAHPIRNIIGMPIDTDAYRARAQRVLDILPDAPFKSICTASEAELIKYSSNAFLFTKVVFVNLMYDLAQYLGADWEVVRAGLSADPRIGTSHMQPQDNSGHSKNIGRGAGGHCFIKDFAALVDLYEELLPEDNEGIKVLKALEKKNAKLLLKSGKDIDMLESVYG